MPGHITVRSIPGRLATGAFILHSGIGKWNLPAERATPSTGRPPGPSLPEQDPRAGVRQAALRFRGRTGAVLLSPFVRDRRAGAALTAFSAGLLTMYWRTPALRKAAASGPPPPVSPSARTSGCSASASADRRRLRLRGSADAATGGGSRFGGLTRRVLIPGSVRRGSASRRARRRLLAARAADGSPSSTPSARAPSSSRVSARASAAGSRAPPCAAVSRTMRALPPCAPRCAHGEGCLAPTRPPC